YRSQCITEYFQISTFDIEAFLTAGHQNFHGNQINDQPQGGHDHHAQTLDFRWMTQTLISFKQNINRNHKQHQGIKQGSQNFKALITKSPFISCWFLSDLDSYQCNS